jgi:protein TonB
MVDLLVGNALAWAAQAAVVVAVGLALTRALRLASPRADLAALRGVLLVCLVLPFLQARQPVPAGGASIETDVALTAAYMPILLADDAGPSAAVRWTTVAMAVYLAGVAARLVWIGVGLGSLRRLRRRSSPLTPLPASVEEACLTVGVRAEFRASPGVARPATFGVHRPVVLVPTDFAAYPPSQQRAIATHELLHVGRRDWARALADELVLSILWFHPLLWWLVDRIRLSVEQVVDREVVELVGERKPYLEALLRLAEASPASLLHPASSLLRHGHLSRRVALLVKEASMSRVRLAVSLVVVCAAVFAGAWTAVQAFPLLSVFDGMNQAAAPAQGTQAQPPADTKVKAVKPDVGVPVADLPPWNEIPANALKVGGAVKPPTKTKDVRPVYPDDARKAGVQGVVIIQAVIDEAGKVKTTRVVRSVPALDEAATAAVRQWEFTPTLTNGNPVPLVVTMTVNFVLDGGAAKDAPPPPPPAPSATVTRAGVNEAQVVRAAPGAPPPPPPPPPPAPSAKVTKVGVTEADAVRLGPDAQPPTILKKADPAYPKAAQEARVQGVVILELVIGKDGKVRSAKAVRSIPELDQAAKDAVMQWEYEPPTIKGKPVDVIATVTMNFKLK